MYIHIICVYISSICVWFTPMPVCVCTLSRCRHLCVHTPMPTACTCAYLKMWWFDLYTHAHAHTNTRTLKVAFFLLILHATKITIFFILLHELHNPIHTHKCTQYFNIYMYTIYVYISCICVCDERILKITKKNKMCRLILCARTHTHIRTQEGNSCLHNAAAQGRNDIVRILLNAGAKITKNQVDRHV